MLGAKKTKYNKSNMSIFTYIQEGGVELSTKPNEKIGIG